VRGAAGSGSSSPAATAASRLAAVAAAVPSLGPSLGPSLSADGRPRQLSGATLPAPVLCSAQAVARFACSLYRGRACTRAAAAARAMQAREARQAGRPGARFGWRAQGLAEPAPVARGISRRRVVGSPRRPPGLARGPADFCSSAPLRSCTRPLRPSRKRHLHAAHSSASSGPRTPS